MCANFFFCIAQAKKDVAKEEKVKGTFNSTLYEQIILM